MSLGDRLHAQHSDEQDEGEWANRHEDAVEALDAIASVAAAIVSNGEREWDATAGALTSAAAHDAAESMLTSESAQDNKEDAMELAVLGDTCPICLQGLLDSVMIQSCYHVYCFECLSTWVQSLALHGVDPPTCPLCKAQFETVFTNVVSEYEYEVFRFHGQQRRDASAITRQREQSAQRQQRLQRRSLVYRRRMRLAKVNGVSVLPLTTAESGLEQLVVVQYPKLVKVQGEYAAWLQRELEACIGADIDLTVLVSLIQCCLDKTHRSDVAKGYRELEAALQPFLYEDAAVFVRELAFFLGSRLNMDAYDAVVEYCCSSCDECVTALCTATAGHSSLTS